ncbi:MAG: DMT family transporter [Thermoflexales bacterium]
MNGSGASYLRAAPAMLGSAFATGSAVVLTRLGIADMSPWMFVALRMVLASAMVLGVAVALGRRPLLASRPRWPQMGLLGVVNAALPIVASTLALRYVSSTILSLLFALMPLFTSLLAHMALADERMSLAKAAGLVVGLFGVALLLLTGSTGVATQAFDWHGYALGFAGVFGAAISSVYIRRCFAGEDLWVLTAVQQVAAAAVVVAIVVLIGQWSLAQVSVTTAALAAYVALMNSVVSFFLFMYLNQRFSATAAALPSYLIPLVTAVLGAALLDEVVTLPMVAGGVLIVGGLWLVNRAA